MSKSAKPFRKGNYYYSDVGGKRTKLCHVSQGLKKGKTVLEGILRQRQQDGGKVYEDLTVNTMFALFLQSVEAERSNHTFIDYQRWLSDFASFHGTRQARKCCEPDNCYTVTSRSSFSTRTASRGRRTLCASGCVGVGLGRASGQTRTVRNWSSIRTVTPT